VKYLWDCRRTFLGLSGVLVLGLLGYLKAMDVSMAISAIVIGIAGANAYEAKKQSNDLG